MVITERLGNEPLFLCVFTAQWKSACRLHKATRLQEICWRDLARRALTLLIIRARACARGGGSPFQLRPPPCKSLRSLTLSAKALWPSALLWSDKPLFVAIEDTQSSTLASSARFLDEPSDFVDETALPQGGEIGYRLKGY